MRTRNDSPFPTIECTDSNCDNRVPKSTKRDYCTCCDNFTQIFGKAPSTVETVSVELEQKQWGYDMFFVIDGNREKRGSFANKEHAEMVKREYEGATHVLE